MIICPFESRYAILFGVLLCWRWRSPKSYVKIVMDHADDIASRAPLSYNSLFPEIFSIFCVSSPERYLPKAMAISFVPRRSFLSGQDLIYISSIKVRAAYHVLHRWYLYQSTVGLGGQLCSWLSYSFYSFSGNSRCLLSFVIHYSMQQPMVFSYWEIFLFS